jgi:hypothetical protein
MIQIRQRAKQELSLCLRRTEFFIRAVVTSITARIVASIGDENAYCAPASPSGVPLWPGERRHTAKQAGATVDFEGWTLKVGSIPELRPPTNHLRRTAPKFARYDDRSRDDTIADLCRALRQFLMLMPYTADMGSSMICLINSRHQRGDTHQRSDRQNCCQDNFNFHVVSPS